MGLLDLVSRGRWSDGSFPVTGAGVGADPAGKITPVALDLTMYRGTREPLVIELSPRTDLRTFSELWLTVKRSLSDSDSAAVFQKTGAAFVIDPIDTNIARVAIDPSDTAALEPYELHFCVDVRAHLTAGPPDNVQELGVGWLTIKPSATAAIV